ncbi:hypothetical protein VB264_04505 [Arcicella aquatica]|uniref:PE-PGRS family protein n=1 Tax=Arcicella aquatica TaxID=217141 RepID=A0ABU5QJS9_9BACT|nr:hypothetical protein [Arcicella aquatica]MEA5257035.1 hypothetical protein [Arcicella aquatica]
MNKLIFLLLLSLVACEEKPTPITISDNFDNPTDLGLIENKAIDEASGLIASQTNKGYLWTHNDSGDSNRIFLMDKAGKGLYEFYLQGATNRDWEAISSVTFPEGSYLYVGEIGDNNAQYDEYAIYKVAEPTIAANTPSVNTLTNVQKITFKYPDGAKDAECMLIDQETKDIYILSKREKNQRLYRIPYPQSFSQTITAEFVEEVSFSVANNQGFYITDGSISADNQEILIKNYLQVFHWRRQTNESIPSALKRAASLLPYTAEPQGEGISFSYDGSSFYTISEESDNKIPVHLYQSKRK